MKGDSADLGSLGNRLLTSSCFGIMVPVPEGTINQCIVDEEPRLMTSIGMFMTTFVKWLA